LFLGACRSPADSVSGRAASWPRPREGGTGPVTRRQGDGPSPPARNSGTGRGSSKGVESRAGLKRLGRGGNSLALVENLEKKKRVAGRKRVVPSLADFLQRPLRLSGHREKRGGPLKGALWSPRKKKPGCSLSPATRKKAETLPWYSKPLPGCAFFWEPQHCGPHLSEKKNVLPRR